MEPGHSLVYVAIECKVTEGRVHMYGGAGIQKEKRGVRRAKTSDTAKTAQVGSAMKAGGVQRSWKRSIEGDA